VRILKDFKCCVLEVRILNELWARFSELRILKGLVTDAGSEKQKRQQGAGGTETKRNVN